MIIWILSGKTERVEPYVQDLFEHLQGDGDFKGEKLETSFFNSMVVSIT